MLLRFALGVASLYVGFRPAIQGTLLVFKFAQSCAIAAVSLSSIYNALSHPPGSSIHGPGGTSWTLLWRLATLQPLRALFTPGSFMRTYAAVVVPAGAVWTVGGLALLWRSALGELARSCATQMAGGAMWAVSLSLAEDAVRRYLLHGRMWMAVLRGCGAAWLAACGTVVLEPEVGKALPQPHRGALATGAAVAGVGGWSLLRQGAGLLLLPVPAPIATTYPSVSTPPSSTPSPTPPTGPDSAFALLVWGSSLTLLALLCVSPLLESALPKHLARLTLRFFDTALAVPKLARLLLHGCRAVWRSQPMQAAWGALTRVDESLSRGLLEACRFTATAVNRGVVAPIAAVTKAVYSKVLQPGCAAVAAVARTVVATCQEAGRVLYARILLPTASATATAARVTAAAARAAALALWRAAIRAATLTWQHVVRPVATRVVVPLLRAAAPVLWPGGAVAGTAWFVAQGVRQGHVLPYGPAAYASAVISCLMLGKAMRKSGSRPLTSLGSSLEFYAARAYLYLDCGTGALLQRLLGVVALCCTLAWALAWSTGHWIIAVVGTPLFNACVAMAVVLGWVAEVVMVVGKEVRDVLVTVWRRPELSILLATAAVAAAYGAHAVGLPAAAARAAVAVASGAVRGLAHGALLLTSPLLRLLSAAAARCGLTPEAPLAVGRAVGGGLAAWGGRAAGDVGGLFASRSFGAAFVGLNLLHALLLRAVAVPLLARQGAAGEAAVMPVVSFVARSTGKVALGPMYITAAAAFAAGTHGGGLGGRIASVTAPTLWLLYLAALWVEGVRRVRLSYDVRHSSELGAALRALREGQREARRQAREARARRAEAELAWRVREVEGRRAGWVDGREAVAAGQGVAPRGDQVQLQPQGQGGAQRGQGQVPGSGPVVRTRRQMLLAELSSQRPPAHVYDTDTCPVCCDELSVAGTGTGKGVGQVMQVGAGAGTTGPSAAGAPGGAVVAGQGPGGAGGVGVEGEVEGDAEADACLVLRCGHTFHSECVLAWLERSVRCPVCREPAVGGSRHSNMFF